MKATKKANNLIMLESIVKKVMKSLSSVFCKDILTKLMDGLPALPKTKIKWGSDKHVLGLTRPRSA